MDFRILGPLEVWDRGRPLELRRQKLRALLAMLLLRAGEPVTSDELIDGLWGEKPPRTARAALQNYVAQLRRVLGPSLLLSRAGGYLLDITPEQTDLGRFERLVGEGGAATGERRAKKLRQALRLWRGPPLADLANEPFVSYEVGHLAELRMAALEDLIDTELSLGAGAELVGELESLIAEQPFRERLRGQLMLALYRAGRQAEALEAYREARRTMIDELGIEPSVPLRELEHAILRQDASLAAPWRAEAVGAPARASTSSTTASQSELLERSSQLTALNDALVAVYNAWRGRLMLVGGEAGVGKTALLRQFCDESPRSARVLWGDCDGLFTPRPLGPFLDIAQITGGELEELLRTGARPHELATALMGELGKRAPTVLVLDDLHWADEATLDVLTMLGRRVEAVPALIIASYRDDELDRAHPLRLVLGELATRRAVGRLKIEPLSPAAVTKMAEPHSVDAAELYRKTAGNPFFVTEALAASEARIPQAVQDAVLARAGRLSSMARTLLEAVATAPPRVELWFLEALGGEAIDGLDECLTSGMLITALGAVAFRHELARLAVDESLTPNRKVALHRKAIAALTTPPTGEPDLARLAHHADAAGEAEMVLRFAPPAAARAASLGAHREAAAHYARALRFGERLSLQERAELLRRRAHECYVTDLYDEAIAAVQQSIAIYRELGDRGREGDGLRSLAQILWSAGSIAEAEDAAREAVTLLEQLPPGRELAMAYSVLASRCMNADDFDEALDWGTRAVELASRLGQVEIVAHALSTIATTEFLAGAPEGPEKLEKSRKLAEREGIEEQVARAYANCAWAAVRRRSYHSLNRSIQSWLDYCDERGLELWRFYLLAYRARSELDQGQWTEAVESGSSVLRVPQTSTLPRIVALVVLGLAHARTGDLGTWDALDEALALAQPSGELQRIEPVAAARAEAAWLEGKHGAVGPATDSALELAVRHRAGWEIAELACWRRRVGIREETPAGAAGPYALLLAGDWRTSAEAWTECGCPYEAALAITDADDNAAILRSLDKLQQMGARPAAAIVAQRLREQHGAGRLRRRPPT
jgi:DNA-binding SARP family transcriptional activator